MANESGGNGEGFFDSLMSRIGSFFFAIGRLFAGTTAAPDLNANIACSTEDPLCYNATQEFSADPGETIYIGGPPEMTIQWQEEDTPVVPPLSKTVGSTGYVTWEVKESAEEGPWPYFPTNLYPTECGGPDRPRMRVKT